MTRLVFGSDEARAIRDRDIRQARRERVILGLLQDYGGDARNALEIAREYEDDLERSPARIVRIGFDRVDADDMTAIISALSAQVKSTPTKQGD